MLELPRRDHQKGIPLRARFNSRGLCLTHTMKITHSLRSHHKRSRQIAVIVLQRQGDGGYGYLSPDQGQEAAEQFQAGSS